MLSFSKASYYEIAIRKYHTHFVQFCYWKETKQKKTTNVDRCCIYVQHIALTFWYDNTQFINRLTSFQINVNLIFLLIIQFQINCRHNSDKKRQKEFTCFYQSQRLFERILIQKKSSPSLYPFLKIAQFFLIFSDNVPSLYIYCYNTPFTAWFAVCVCSL